MSPFDRLQNMTEEDLAALTPLERQQLYNAALDDMQYDLDLYPDYE